MTASIRNLITVASSFSRSVTPVTPGTPPTLGVTRPARHRPSGHKLSRPPMPQGLPAHRPPAYPGTAPPEPQQHPNSRRQQNQDRRTASATTNEPAASSRSSTTPQNWPFCASRGSTDLPLRHAVFGDRRGATLSRHAP